MSLITKILNKLKAILSGESDLKEIITKSSSAMVLRVVGMATNYLFLTFVIFKFGSEGWGIFAICFSILQFTSMVGTLGMDMSLVKLYASDKYDKKELFKHAVTYSLPVNLFLVIIIFWNADLIGSFFKGANEIGFYIRYTALGIIPFSYSLIIAGAYRGLKKIAIYTFFDSLGRFIFGLITVFVLSFFLTDDKVVIIGFVVGLYLLLLIQLFTFMRTLSGFKGNNEDKEAYSGREMLKFSLSLFWNPIANRGIGWVTVFILGYYVSKSDVGIYDTCLRLGSFLFIVQFAINSISASKFAEFNNHGDMNKLKKITQHTTKLIFYIVTPLFIVLTLGGWWVLDYFGTEFSENYLVFFYIVIGQYVGSLSSSVGVFMQMTGLHIAYRNILIFVLVVNFVLAILLVPTYGIEGGAIVMGIVLMLKNVLGVIHIYQKTKIKLFYIPFLRN